MKNMSFSNSVIVSGLALISAIFVPSDQRRESDYLEDVHELDALIHASRLDGKEGFSREETLAAATLISNYSSAFIKDHIHDSPDSKARSVLVADVQGYYDSLLRVRPQEELIYLDFSDFDSFYRENIEKITGRDLKTWKRTMVAELKDHFRSRQGKRLNIRFTDAKPINGDFTTVRFWPDSFESLMYSDREFQVHVLHHFSAVEDQDVQKKAKRIIEGIQNCYQDPMERLDDIFRDAEFRTLLSGTLNLDHVNHEIFGYHLAKEEEFGNPNHSEMVWINLGHFLALAREDQFDRLKEDPSQASRTLAAITAHEIGHSLGLEHPNVSLVSHFGIQEGYEPKDIANNMMKSKMTVFARVHFNGYQLDYLTFVLGEQADFDEFDPLNDHD